MEITFNGKPLQTRGMLPEIGSNAPDFTLVRSDLSTVSLKDFKGKNVIMNIFPSLDTPVCGGTVIKFNEEATQHPQNVILCISMDLPFAQKRFCTQQGLNNVITLSAFRNRDFGDNYGLTIMDGPLSQLLARTVIVVNKEGKIAYSELVPEITHEPDYGKALQVAQKLGVS